MARTTASRRYEEAREKVDVKHYYTLDETISLVKETATASFDETVDCAIKLGVETGKGEQNVRGTVVLPNGTGKDPRGAKRCVPPRRRAQTASVARTSWRTSRTAGRTSTSWSHSRR